MYVYFSFFGTETNQVYIWSEEITINIIVIVSQEKNLIKWEMYINK